MQSYTEVDKEDLYTLKINCKGKTTVGKENKRTNAEKIIVSLKIKIKKRKKGKRHRTAKSNIEAEVYKKYKNCD